MDKNKGNEKLQIDPSEIVETLMRRTRRIRVCGTRAVMNTSGKGHCQMKIQSGLEAWQWCPEMEQM